ncbi:MAG: helix-turn-helix domain-containing protein [bacterium]
MEQKNAFEILKTGRNVFLTGSAGTGKTYLLNQYVQYLKNHGIAPAIVAPTGIAASHIGGMTIHSFFGIGIQENINEYMIDSLMQKKYVYKRMEKLKILIIDEISMVSPELFTSIDKILRAFKFSTKPFGGVQLVLSGDFFQLPPISKKNKKTKFAWQITSWDEANLKICYLKEKFRQSGGVLIDILDEIRSNSVSENSMKVFRSCYKKELLNDFKVTKLYTHNIDVDRINKANLEALLGEMKIYLSKNRGSKKNIERIFKSSLVKEKLSLKKDAVVIFIKNNYEQGYINGTLGKIVGFSKITGTPIVKVFSGREITTDYEDWNFENKKGDVVATVKQIPLRLAWALTIHKSQGMTLDAAEIDLSKTFEVGQGYVALSRIKSIDGLRLMGLNKIALQVDEQVLNIDQKMMRLSRLNILKFKSFSKKEKDEMYNNCIIQHGGSIEKKIIAKSAIKENTLEMTKKLLVKKKNITEIAKKRKLSRNTIINHITKIHRLHPSLDISYLMPKEKILMKVSKAIDKIRIKENPDNLSEKSQIKLKPIFEYLNKKMIYDDIRLALVFLLK